MSGIARRKKNAGRPAFVLWRWDATVVSRLGFSTSPLLRKTNRRRERLDDGSANAVAKG